MIPSALYDWCFAKIKQKVSGVSYIPVSRTLDTIQGRIVVEKSRIILEKVVVLRHALARIATLTKTVDLQMNAVFGEKCTQDGCSEYSTDRPIQDPRESTSPPWRVAVIVTAAVVLLIALGASVFWCYKRRQPSNSTNASPRSLQTGEVSNASFNNAIPQQQNIAFTLEPSSKPCPQEPHIPTYSGPTPRNYDGYVIPALGIPGERVYEDPDAVGNIELQAGPQLYPRRASDNPPLYTRKESKLGLRDAVIKNSDLFQRVFCFYPQVLSSDSFEQLFVVNRSEQLSNIWEVENRLLAFWREFLLDVEEKECELNSLFLTFYFLHQG